ncbi:hypothetical protein HHK36_013647 [Tetracentron sinense]|uniref:Uncharacterized protein n=1 Tax=Tetracentron sinense TaxID=13715 RepID=A0A834Z6P5_TETSI|nr:hypothetical protein HHK36_013647 [Tetracentron sinense]
MLKLLSDTDQHFLQLDEMVNISCPLRDSEFLNRLLLKGGVKKVVISAPSKDASMFLWVSMRSNISLTVTLFLTLAAFRVPTASCFGGLPHHQI